MKEIVSERTFVVPGTNVVVEKGDRIRVKESEGLDNDWPAAGTPSKSEIDSAIFKLQEWMEGTYTKDEIYRFGQSAKTLSLPVLRKMMDYYYTGDRIELGHQISEALTIITDFDNMFMYLKSIVPSNILKKEGTAPRGKIAPFFLRVDAEIVHFGLFDKANSIDLRSNPKKMPFFVSVESRPNVKKFFASTFDLFAILDYSPRTLGIKIPL